MSGLSSIFFVPALQYKYILISSFPYRCTEAVLLLSGYHSVPRRKMMWERQQDCFNELVAKNIRRNQMDAVLTCLHFRDNADMDGDGFYKVRYRNKLTGT